MIIMKKYEYGRINTLFQKLKEAQIDNKTIIEIIRGGELIRKTTNSKKKAEWMKDAMIRMDKLLDSKIRYSIREACACCLGGKRFKKAKEIFKNNDNFNSRIDEANTTKFLFGHSVTLQNDGKILVSFYPNNLEKYKCVCLPKAEEPISITYCYCCGGHVKHHLQAVLGIKLELKVRSSALSSDGKKPCTFLFKIIDEACQRDSLLTI